ncbi:hypothetical protein NUSPORA_00594 [Nucleospora cyclopteri]
MNFLSLFFLLSFGAFDEIRPRAVYLGEQVCFSLKAKYENLKAKLNKLKHNLFKHVDLVKEKIISAKEGLIKQNIVPEDVKKEVDKLLQKSKKIEVVKEIKDKIMEQEESKEKKEPKRPAEEL